MKKTVCTVSAIFIALVAAFPVSDTVTVGYRQEYLAPGDAFSLQFDSLLRDWRSPEGSPVNYGKNVKVRISLAIQGQKYQTDLSLLDGEQNYAIAQGLRFELLAVEPRPLSPVEDYSITLAVRDCEDVGQYLVEGKFEEARKVIDEWLEEPEEWVIPANIYFPVYVLEKLTEWLEYHLAVSGAQLLCHNCIKTNPVQSEIIISYSSRGMYDCKVLDILSGSPMRTAGFHGFDGTRLLLLQVDYTGNRLEAVKDLFFPEQSGEFTVVADYKSPVDFGYQKLYYKELEQMFFYGTIVWMGCGEIIYPKIWNIPHEYPLTAQRDMVIPRNSFERVGLQEGWEPPSEEMESAWRSVAPLVLAREFIAASPEEKVKVYFYTPSVGMGDPRDWKWIFILRNQSPSTAIANIPLAECRLYQNAPNPFSQNTQIGFYLPQNIKTASLNIYNLQGKQLKQIDIAQRGEGSQVISGLDLAAGIYLYALIADGREVDVKRMVLME